MTKYNINIQENNDNKIEKNQGLVQYNKNRIDLK